MSARRFSCWARLRRRAHAGGWLRVGLVLRAREKLKVCRCGEVFPVFKASRLPGALSRCSAALRRAVVSVLSAARHLGAHVGGDWHFDEFSARHSGHPGVLVPTAMFVPLRRVLVAVLAAGLHPGAHLDGCWLLDVCLSRGKRQFDCPVLGHDVLGSPLWRRHRHAVMRAACSVRTGCACRRRARLARARCRLAASSLVAVSHGPSRRRRCRRGLVPESGGRAGGLEPKAGRRRLRPGPACRLSPRVSALRVSRAGGAYPSTPLRGADTRALKRVLVPLGQVPPYFGPEPVPVPASVQVQAGLMVLASCSALACCRPGRRGATAGSRAVRSQLPVSTSARLMSVFAACLSGVRGGSWLLRGASSLPLSSSPSSSGSSAATSLLGVRWRLGVLGWRR